MDAKPCVHCGKPVSDTALKCPHCGAQGPQAKANARAALLGCGFVLLLVVGFCGYVGNRFDQAVERAATAPPAPDATTPGRWHEIAAIVQGNGATVEPFDPATPRTMRIRLPAGLGATAEEARRLAVTTRERLGSDAIVYVKDSSGLTLAKAAPWGVE